MDRIEAILPSLGNVLVDVYFSGDVCISLDRRDDKYHLFNFEYHDGTKWVEEADLTFDNAGDFLNAIQVYFSRDMEELEIKANPSWVKR